MHLNEGDFRSRLIDLPHVELLVLFDAAVHLVRFVALGRAAVHHVGNFDRFALTGQLPYQVEDLIRGVWNAVREKWERKRCVRSLEYGVQTIQTKLFLKYIAYVMSN